MKDVSELNFPEDLRYSDNHEWAEQVDGVVRVGISDYAQNQLGDIVFVELPEVGDTFEKGGEFGTVESVKAVSELYMPVGGEITAINEALEEAPELVNNDPYSGGWMIDVRLENPAEYDELKDQRAYFELLKG
jgi:glycine cleavage system H protein